MEACEEESCEMVFEMASNSKNACLSSEKESDAPDESRSEFEAASQVCDRSLSFHQPCDLKQSPVSVSAEVPGERKP